MINIEITGINNNYKIERLCIKKGTTIDMLVNNILNIDARILHFGVFGKPQELSYTLQDKDRVEFYEKIIANPKIKRKNRAENI
tara:strand:- start:1104 stop:1355 length:252 start_codon:yes stop_codon:yes gene_type:complete